MKAYTLEDYEITYDGQVINKRTGHILKPQPNGKGYLRVVLGGQRYFVHRLVAQKYVPNENGYDQVNHKDGNKLNNCADNLEWVTNQQNRNHAVQNGLQIQGEDCPWSKLDEEKVHYIREHLEISNTELAEEFGVSPAAIRAVRNYKSWKHC